MKKTLVVGASDNPERYSCLAIQRLLKYGHEVVAFGLHPGNIEGVPIQTDKILYPDLHTVTVYVNPSNQSSITDYILQLKPKRIIFNPGAENPEFESRAAKLGIEVTEACTLVLLSTGQY